MRRNKLVPFGDSYMLHSLHDESAFQDVLCEIRALKVFREDITNNLDVQINNLRSMLNENVKAIKSSIAEANKWRQKCNSEQEQWNDVHHNILLKLERRVCELELKSLPIKADNSPKQVTMQELTDLVHKIGYGGGGSRPIKDNDGVCDQGGYVRHSTNISLLQVYESQNRDLTQKNNILTECLDRKQKELDDKDKVIEHLTEQSVCLNDTKNKVLKEINSLRKTLTDLGRITYAVEER